MVPRTPEGKIWLLLAALVGQGVGTASAMQKSLPTDACTQYQSWQDTPCKALQLCDHPHASRPGLLPTHSLLLEWIEMEGICMEHMCARLVHSPLASSWTAAAEPLAGNRIRVKWWENFRVWGLGFRPSDWSRQGSRHHKWSKGARNAIPLAGRLDNL